MMKPKHWAVFTLIEYMNVAKALCSWNKKRKKLQVVPQITVYFIVAQNAIVDDWIHWLTLGYLILTDIYKERDKDKVLL